MKRITIIASLIFGIMTAILAHSQGWRMAMTPAAPGKNIAPGDVQTYAGKPFYDEATLRTLFLTFEDRDWERRLEQVHGTETDVAASLLVDGKTFRDVGVRFRGMSSYMGVPEGRKRSLNLSIDTAGRFHIIPHDTNETFATGGGPGGPRGFAGPRGRGGRSPFGPDNRGGRGEPGGMRGGGGGPTLDPLAGLQDPSKPLRSKLLAVPELRKKYLGYVNDIASKWLDWNTLGPIVERYKTLIDADVKADTKKLDSYDAFISGTTGSDRSLKTFATARRAFLSGSHPRNPRHPRLKIL